MQKSWSYIKDSGDFVTKMSQIGNIHERAILVTDEEVHLSPSIPHGAGL